MGLFHFDAKNETLSAGRKKAINCGEWKKTEEACGASIKRKTGKSRR